jgi:hypothetical protein
MVRWRSAVIRGALLSRLLSVALAESYDFRHATATDGEAFDRR